MKYSKAFEEEYAVTFFDACMDDIVDYMPVWEEIPKPCHASASLRYARMLRYMRMQEWALVLLNEVASKSAGPGETSSQLSFR